MYKNIFILLSVSLFYAGFAFSDTLPGILSYDSDLAKRISEMEKNKQNPLRTKHLDSNGTPKFTNRLALESSPYLLQHAHNPVNWYPWGEKAFEAAKQLDRPVLLSIGYSTCHWCHVMEEESFEDIEIATYLNEHYIAVKVDREERPDIDSVYMKAVMALQGSGGWPMTLFLTWDKKPFYGGTYFPARDGDRGTSLGFLTLLKKLNQAYHIDHQAVKTAGHTITTAIEQAAAVIGGSRLPTNEMTVKSIEAFKKGFDWENGGLIGQNKFPSSLPLGLLMRHYMNFREDQVLDMITLTLDKMMNGGIHDHVAGGFHRYATDSTWHIPHYEKMLYDNALLSIAYTEAYQLTGNERYKHTAQKTLDYLLKEMQSPEGGFFSATDADSLTPSGNLEEGYFFTWTVKEIDALFDKHTSKIIKGYYGFNDREDLRQVLHVSGQEHLIADEKISAKDLATMIATAHQLLYKERSNRKLPGRDDKIILSWNSLVISALAKAGFAFNQEKYIHAAIQTHGFIFKNLWQNQLLFHSFKDNKRGHEGFLDDYAFLAAALIDLYEATFDIQWLLKAMDIDAFIQKKFEDKAHGGFFMTPAGQRDLIAREKPSDDGALPSGNCIAAMNLIRLYLYTDQKRYRERAENALKFFSDRLLKSPEYLSGILLASELLTRPAREMVIIMPKDEAQTADPFLDILRKRFQPGRVIVVAREGKQFDAISKTLPLVRGKKALKGMTTAYPCEGSICRQPITKPSDL
ncbi:MAG: thioredoxin domain-containing protein [Proteobacteria bacterium]|nr:thioredoxin domain-containing protein [Pseudomonadota bacterium]